MKPRVPTMFCDDSLLRLGVKIWLERRYCWSKFLRDEAADPVL